MATIKVKQTKSRIKCPKDQKRTLDALGLMKMNQKPPKINAYTTKSGIQVPPALCAANVHITNSS